MTEVQVGALDKLPGFRRRFVVTPKEDRVTAAVEDDYHCMAVILGHDGARITEVGAVMDRAPWTTCPGAAAVLRQTFTGALLDEAAARGMKQANCTHLYDLAVLAAAHAREPRPLCYDILVTDPVDGQVVAEVRLDGTAVHRLVHVADVVESPAELAGLSLFKLRGWIESLGGSEREAARLLQWGTILAHGRQIPLAQQSDASRLPPNCYTFQPENKDRARRVGRIFDFTLDAVAPLGYFDGEAFSPRQDAVA